MASDEATIPGPLVAALVDRENFISSERMAMARLATWTPEAVLPWDQFIWKSGATTTCSGIAQNRITT